MLSKLSVSVITESYFGAGRLDPGGGRNATKAKTCLAAEDTFGSEGPSEERARFLDRRAGLGHPPAGMAASITRAR